MSLKSLKLLLWIYSLLLIRCLYLALQCVPAIYNSHSTIIYNLLLPISLYSSLECYNKKSSNNTISIELYSLICGRRRHPKSVRQVGAVRQVGNLSKRANSDFPSYGWKIVIGCPSTVLLPLPLLLLLLLLYCCYCCHYCYAVRQQHL